MKDRIFINAENFFLYMSVVIGGAICYYMMPYYILGDQFHYRDLYLNVSEYPFLQAFDYYKGRIDSQEPIYFSIVWLSSSLGIPKDFLMLMANISLIWLGFKVFVRAGAHPAVAFFLLCFSYYSFVFYFSAERLKFSLIFFLIFLAFSKYKLFFFVVSILCHAQMIIPFVSFLAYSAKSDIKLFFTKFKMKKQSLIIFFTLPILAFFIFFVLRNHLQSKMESYFNIHSILELSKIFVLFLLSFFYAKDKFATFLVFIPLFFVVAFVGGERVNVIGYFAFLFFALHYRRGFNLGVLATTFYFSIQGFGFLKRIIIYGNGFYQL